MTKRRSLMGGRLVAAVVVASLAACSDMPTAASTPQRPLQVATIDAPVFHLNGTTDVPLVTANDTVYGTFTVRPRKSDIFMIGERRALAFPAKAICEPATSTYGVGTWNDPCSPTRSDIKVSFKSYYTESGSLRLDFSPALRFNPLTEGVYLVLDEPTSIRSLSGLLGLSPWLKTIYYCPDVGECIDESLTDPTLKTVYDWKNNILLRRIKHFSGYNVAVGLDDGSLY